MQLESTLTCPSCGHQSVERMQTDTCQFFYDCKGRGIRLKPLAGDCCIFCSLLHGDLAGPEQVADDLRARDPLSRGNDHTPLMKQSAG